jgi:phosphoheptose isomerase
MIELIKNSFMDSIRTKQGFLNDETAMKAFQDAAKLFVECYASGSKVLVCGNGGSASDSQHMAAELVVRLEKNRKALPCIALGSSIADMTAAGNDLSFDKVFSRQVEAMGNRGDILFAISTSGNSPNIIEAVNAARSTGMTVIGLTGNGGGKLAGIADIAVKVNGSNTARIQETHILLIHLLCKIIEDSVL